MLKNLIFFVLFFFCFVLLVCLFVFCLGGGAHASQGKQREDKSLPTEYKRGTTEN